MLPIEICGDFVNLASANTLTLTGIMGELFGFLLYSLTQSHKWETDQTVQTN